MYNQLPDEGTTAHHALFSSLRVKLAREVSSSAMLADLLQKVNEMQEASAKPAEFEGKFNEFVGRAEEYSSAIKPFFPDLTAFLPSRPAPRFSQGVCCR
jgi:hypothetical protein